MKPYFLAVAMAIGMSAYDLKAQPDSKSEADKLFEISSNLDGSKLDSLRLLSRQIASLSNKVDYDLGKIRSLLVGALYGLNKLKLDSSLALLDDAEKLVGANPGHEKLIEAGIIDYYRAQIVYRRMRFDEAEAYCEKALAVFERNHDLFLMGRVYSLRGVIEKLRQNELKGLTLFLKAYRLKLESGVDEKKAREDLLQIGRSYRLMGQYEKSLEYFRKVERMFRSTPDNLVLSTVYQDIGATKTEMSENDSALYFLTKSKQIADRNNSLALSAIADETIAMLLTSMNRFHESNKYVVPLINKSGHLRFSPMAASTRLTAARNYFQLKKYDSAMLLAKSGFDMTRRDQKKRSQFAKIVSEVFEVRSNRDSALYYLKIHTSVQDSAFSIENQRKLSTLYAEIETLSTQNQIELLEKQTALDQAQKKFLVWAIVFGSIVFAFVIVMLRLQHRHRKKALEFEKRTLQQELEMKKKDLHEQALKMIYLNNSITEIESTLKRLQSEHIQDDIRHVLSTIHVNKSLEKEWDNFNEYFSSVHSGFYEKIDSRYANLTIAEKRLAGLIRMNMTNSEIAGILNIESNSVKTAKYRLKKKVGLSDEEDIHSFMQKL